MGHSKTSGAQSTSGVGPLVRPSRSQAEIDLLPPYGDPEVTLTGELGTYLALGGAAAVAYTIWRR